MTSEGVHELHVKVIPNFNSLVPRSGNNNLGLVGVVEFDTGDGISVLILVNGVLALTLCVPDLDVMVKTTSNELSVVGVN